MEEMRLFQHCRCTFCVQASTCDVLCSASFVPLQDYVTQLKRAKDHLPWLSTPQYSVFFLFLMGRSMKKDDYT